MNAEELKQQLRASYGARAQMGDSAPGCCAKPVDAPGGSRSSFGCGNPLAVASIAPGQRVVDVGSGPGLDALAAARRVGPTGAVLGVDMTEEMLARARQNAAAEGLGNVEFLSGDAESLPAPDCWADWVISNCVVNLVPDKDKAFQEIFRVLKPGGRVSITDLIGEDLPTEILADTASLCACIGGAPSEGDYLGSIRKAGFEQVEVVDRFEWDAPELEGKSGRVWSLKITAVRPA